MSKFKEPMFRDYRNSEFLQFMKNVLELVNNTDVSLLGLTEQQQALLVSTEALAMAFEPEQFQKNAEVLESLDAERDSLYVGIKHLLKGHGYHFNPTKQEAVKRLLFHLQSYGKEVNRMNYQAQTANITHMLSEWQSETILQEAVVLLDLSEWVSTLQEVNTAFGNQYVARASEISANATPSFSSLRTATKAAYRALVARIKAFMVLNSNVVYTQLYRQIYELARLYNQVVKVRSKALRRK
ncbi:DUF6261 family protein [uncultured Kordia sp.]|uniref:DUF6261 family protein n=1 Tax=uncultured Kordia sp. TaxID=507699 RepID=UPI002636C3FE|nr:DUF6261 family protein [uncultured Kordia sp.]